MQEEELHVCLHQKQSNFIHNWFADEITDLGYLNGVCLSTMYLINSNIFV